MNTTLELKPRVCFQFEVEKVIGVSADGNYQVQWAPAWVSKFHLVGCEHLIQEFLQKQQTKIESLAEPISNLEGPDASTSNTEANQCGENLDSFRSLNTSDQNSLPHAAIKSEAIEEDGHFDTIISDEILPTTSGGSNSTSNLSFNINHDSLSIYSKTRASTTTMNGVIKIDKGIPFSVSSEYTATTTLQQEHEEEQQQEQQQLQEQQQHQQQLDQHHQQQQQQKHNEHHRYDVCNSNLEAPACYQSNHQEPAERAPDVNDSRDELYTSTEPEESDDQACSLQYIIKVDIADEDDDSVTTRLHDASAPLDIDIIDHGASESIFPKSTVLCGNGTRDSSNEAHCSESADRSVDKALKHECYICHKQFSLASTLKSHLKIHSSEKTFQCQHCSKKFTQSSALSRHLRLHSERTFACPHCHRKFSRKDHLKRHVQTHSRVRAFSCHLCDQSCASKAGLSAHIRKQHTDYKRLEEPCSENRDENDSNGSA